MNECCNVSVSAEEEGGAPDPRHLGDEPRADGLRVQDDVHGQHEPLTSGQPGHLPTR